ncbi:TPA: hypothetical protein U1W10_000428 [Streptococcus suis]|nr:hypothetical protein [Streptococcus suis]
MEEYTKNTTDLKLFDEYEPPVVESFKNEVVSQFIKENFVDILNKQFTDSKLKPKKFLDKFFNDANVDNKKLSRWRNGEVEKLKDEFVEYFRVMPALETMFLSHMYTKIYTEQFRNQDKHFQSKLGKELSALGLDCIVSNAVNGLYRKLEKEKDITVDGKSDSKKYISHKPASEKFALLKKELDLAYSDYIDDI